LFDDLILKARAPMLTNPAVAALGALPDRGWHCIIILVMKRRTTSPRQWM